VTELIVYDPLHNARINRNGNKDGFKLCRLLRMDELVPVYHADVSHRVDFKVAMQQYCNWVMEICLRTNIRFLIWCKLMLAASLE